MQRLKDEDTIIVLETMLKLCKGFSQTEKEAIKNAINVIEWKQNVESIVNDLYNEKELISREKLSYKVCDTLLEAANCGKYGSKHFKLGEKIYYTPTEVEDILECAIEEGDL